MADQVNEAAERLRETMRTEALFISTEAENGANADLDAALVTERRNTERETLLEFGQWLANAPDRIYDLQDTLDVDDPAAFVALVDRFLALNDEVAS